MGHYVILPGADDSNRGDQALVWETVQLAKDAGFHGFFWMLADEKKSMQSVQEGLGIFDGILLHPSRCFSNKNNMKYSLLLLLKWGCVAAFDFLFSSILLIPFFRAVFERIGSQRIRTALTHIKNANAVFVKGGGFLHSNGGVTSTFKMYYFLYHLVLAQSYHKDIYIMPNSFGPFIGFGVKKMMHGVLSKCKKVTCRESVSHDILLQDCQITADIYPDFGFFLKKENSATVQDIIRQSKIPFKHRKCVALTLRPYRFPEHKKPDEKYRRYQQSFAEFVDWLSSNNYFPVFIEHTLSVSYHESDLNCIRDVVGLLGTGTPYEVLSIPELNCRELKEIYSRFDYIVGTRFHSIVFSLSEGVPGIAITYGGNKGQGIMKDMGLGEYAIDIGAVTCESLISKFGQMLENEDLICASVRDNLSIAATSRTGLVNEIKKLGHK